MRRAKIAVFASGSGSNYEAIVEACRDGRIAGDVVLLVCDKPGAKVLERAKRYGTESFAFNPKDYASREAYETVLAEAKTNLAAMRQVAVEKGMTVFIFYLFLYST